MLISRAVKVVVLSFFATPFFVCGAMKAAAQDDTGERPNCVVFIADDMAWDDCGVYGHPKIRTPHVDRLAHEGMRFDNAFLTCSSCSPSRASLITGRYPHNTGAHQLHMPLPGEQITFIELLRASGYYTAAAGKWHMGQPTKPKFDKVVTKMNRWVDTLKKRPRDRPFCMWFAFTDPHRPYQQGTTKKPHQPSDAVVPPYLPDVEETRADLAMYYDEIARLDGVVGKVNDELKRQQVAERTVVVFLSDNGRPFPRCKTTVYDSGVKTPFIVSWPGRVKPGSVTKSLVSTVDLAPTLLELAGLDAPDSFQGKSFVPILNDPTVSIRDEVFAEHNWHDFDDHGRAVRTHSFKYIRNAYFDVPGTPPADAVRSITYRAMLRLRDESQLAPEQSACFVTPRPREELYDVVRDPHELNNLADAPEHAQTLRELRKRLDDWQQATDDVVPEKRRPDGFDRESGERLKHVGRR